MGLFTCCTNSSSVITPSCKAIASFCHYCQLPSQVKKSSGWRSNAKPSSIPIKKQVIIRHRFIDYPFARQTTSYVGGRRVPYTSEDIRRCYLEWEQRHVLCSIPEDDTERCGNCEEAVQFNHIASVVWITLTHIRRFSRQIRVNAIMP
ncbi:hypothetical protein THRCLA_20826 [Thraustotheca clavata]|uniref:Uncharacterized protein n=1 Tax=Thraustotheca clavata TaxID=74557 RepID=A0A1W0A3N7_9STRA|nr:hypothetical protein THRCLA_20826 [Thraustotheca clavata]